MFCGRFCRNRGRIMIGAEILSVTIAVAVINLKASTAADVCPEIPPIQHGDVVVSDGPPHPDGTTVDIQCDEGFENIGPRTITCLKGGRWSHDFIRCNYSADIQCHMDLKQVDKNRKCRKYCENDEDCQGALKKCRCDDWCGMSCFNPESECPEVMPPENGYVLGKHYFYGYKVKYGCNDGFILSGHATRKCRSDRTWSGDKPKCLLISSEFNVCGVSGDQTNDVMAADVTKGKYANEAAWPWQALLFHSGNGAVAQIYDPHQNFGGGSIIDNKWILTASHIFDTFLRRRKNVEWKNVFFIVVGMTARPESFGSIPDHMHVFEPLQIYRHQKYDARSYDYDIALIRIGKRLERRGSIFAIDSTALDPVIEFSRHVMPVCLPCMTSGQLSRASDILNNFDEKHCESTTIADLLSTNEFRDSGNSAVTSGFGYKRDPRSRYPYKPVDLQEEPVKIQKEEICAEGAPSVDTARLICVTRFDSNKNIVCARDGGGPLVKKFYRNRESAYWMQVGIMTKVIGCEDTQLGYYTSLASMMPWIWNTIDRLAGWGNWSKCSTTCGPGEKTRRSFCQSDETGDCVENKIQTVVCNENVKCSTWSSWENLTSCSVTCGGGTKTMKRICNNGREDNVGCLGRSDQSVSCNTEPCYSEWGPWSACDRTCGSGFNTRTRKCINDFERSECPGALSQSKNCSNVPECWSNWGEWGECDVICGAGYRNRSRVCMNGDVGDDGCLGKTFEVDPKPCNAFICLRWSPWGPWEWCSVTCGDGIRTRTRICIGGNQGDPGCEGPKLQNTTCKEKDCVSWGTWGDWSGCDVTCGSGTRTRLRVCINGDVGDPGCVGEREDLEECVQGSCGVWSEWSTWSSCSKSCNGGLMRRTRTCINENADDFGCQGENFEEDLCNLGVCAGWGEWGEFTTCTTTCGGGQRTRSRICIKDKSGNAECKGEASKTETCKKQECPYWGPWGQWEDCDDSCGGGQRLRYRECLNGNIGDYGCRQHWVTTKLCNSNICPRWSKWVEWGSCKAVCGNGTRVMQRICFGGKPGGDGCEGTYSKQIPCKGKPCSSWEPWGNWGKCDKTCGNGVQIRIRGCVNGEVGDPGCVGETKESSGCSRAPCGFWSLWSSWSSCSEPCDGGVTTRTRKCINGIEGRGGCAGYDVEINPCNTYVCQKWSAWGNWSVCTVTCGHGQRTRNRMCSGGNPGAIGCEGDDVENILCNTKDCEFWGPWGLWGECSTTCGGGVIGRSRKCIYGNVNDNGCRGELTDTNDCNTRICPFWTSWGKWESCTLTCGVGTRSRRRICIGEVEGQTGCDGSMSEKKPCKEQSCVSWESWGSWSGCNVRCGNGAQVRIRRCLNGDVGDPGCVGKLQELKGCFLDPCDTWSAWRPWAECSKTCDGGHTRRLRTCINGTVGKGGCVGNNFEDASCKINTCPTRSLWSPWSACTVSCGNGVRTRNRKCSGGNIGDLGCEGDFSESKSCNSKICEFWSVWSPWECDVTCKTGIKRRYRACNHGNVGDEGCLGESFDTGPCYLGPCPRWNKWLPWGDCVQGRGAAIRTRIRNCINGNPGQLGCKGTDSEVEFCDIAEDSWTMWEPWTICNKPCGDGLTSRKRTCRLGEDKCRGHSLQTNSCNMQECAKWLPWTQWTTCTVTCEGGKRTRNRFCNRAIDGSGCDGISSDTEECNSQKCEAWSSWGPWQGCNATCGIGQRLRYRMCNYGNYGDTGCRGRWYTSDNCNAKPCPEWNEWQDWGECSVSCDSGIRKRIRICRNGIPGDVGCEGLAIQPERCGELTCASWEVWKTWSRCDVTCGKGVRVRFRDCRDGKIGEPGCLENEKDSTECIQKPCSSWLFWAQWSKCSKSCNGGVTKRTRTCVGGIVGSRGCQGVETEGNFCNVDRCEFWGGWKAWTECDVTCGGGWRLRSRECINGDVGDNGCRGVSSISEPCNPNACEYWSGWGPWDKCDVTCGGGQRRRLRNCINGTHRDAGCRGKSIETVFCNSPICSRWSEWSNWGSCSATCGGGTSSRRRPCIGAKIGDSGCEERGSETKYCIEKGCPFWTRWGSWSGCHATCGESYQSRTRDCQGGDISGCTGSSRQYVKCISKPCGSWSNWKSWSICSHTCDGGISSRSRICIGGIPGTGGCLNGNPKNIKECNTHLCPTWASWLPWKDCSVTCGGGERARSRSCSGGIAGDDGCEGSAQENDAFACNTQDCEFWSNWSSWGKCRVTCGGGEQLRHRECINGKIGDVGCRGLRKEPKVCNVIPCSTWSDWSEWKSCSVSCGNGLRNRNRLCIGGEPGTAGCEGIDSTSEICRKTPCAAWQQWGRFSVCSVTCGKGVQSRFRTCLHGVVGKPGCVGKSQQNIECSKNPCGSWSVWGRWEKCSKSCGGGSMIRKRNCVSGFTIQTDCEGSKSKDTDQCNVHICPNWSRWSLWSACTTSCNGGQRTRDRECIGGNNGDLGCRGLPSQTEKCSDQNCKLWQSWGPWSKCDVTCGKGNKQRTRQCTNGKVRVFGCQGQSILIEPCQVKECEFWGTWGAWAACDVTCGKGQRLRSRKCVNSDVGDSGCRGESRNSEQCNSEPCPEWSQWQNWGKCSMSCGSGIKTRIRSCSNGMPGDTGCAGVDLQRERCVETKCEFWRSWGAWGECDVTCGGGKRLRSRECLNGDVGDNGCRGLSVDSQRCNSKPCSKWDEWQNWEECSVSCGGGIRKSRRICRNGVPGDVGCEGRDTQEDRCGATSCGSWSFWTQWSTCTKSCNRGTITRTRICNGGTGGRGGCLGAGRERKYCNTNKCESWGGWGAWGKCDVTCGGGERSRDRKCINGDVGDNGCRGDSKESEQCNSKPCGSWLFWTQWSKCTKSCNGGAITRTRVCIGGTVGSGGCLGAGSERKPCNTNKCELWGLWGAWAKCDVTCGGGERSRDRKCINGDVGDNGCRGDSRNTERCNSKPCPGWAEWQNWKKCSVSCGDGIRTRSRICRSGVPGDVGCEGVDTEEERCGATACGSWTFWTRWSKCSKSCNRGITTRTRVCNGGTAESDGCRGAGSERKSCNTDTCTRWASWGLWNECDVTCGGRRTLRYRKCINGKAGDDGCPGEEKDSTMCNSWPCPEGKTRVGKCRRKRSPLL